MKAQTIVTVVATALTAVGVATADPQNPAPTPGSPEAYHSHNCVAVFSSDFTHNGTVVSQEAQAGQRSDDVQAIQGKQC
jgi:hypothetical protein